MPTTPNEALFETATIERLKHLGYRHQTGGELERHLHIVVLTDLLRTHLQRRYAQLPIEVIEQAVQRAGTPEGVDLERRNLNFQRMLRSGLTLHYEQDGTEQSAHVYLVDFDQADRNDFLVVSQLSIRGGGSSSNTRRTDLVVYVNGLPLVVFELKSPWDEFVDTVGAYNQLRHYQADIPQLFNCNAFCIVSDGVTTLHGPHSAGFEWYAPWKSIDGAQVEPNTTGSMKTLLEGLFPKDRLLDYVRNFILHEVVNDQVTKKIAKYHQFFAVRFAVQKVLAAMQPGSDGRAGVIWHTQGSGKSLSMAFLIGILRRWPGLNPTILVQVDRTDLDSQLFDTFVGAKDLVGDVRQAESIDELRDALRTAGGEFICSTLQKFQRRKGEARHDVLTERHNLLVIADEAHRTQYGVLEGFAAYLRQALPNAAFIGFTGTPIDTLEANTTQIFGDYIHTYDMQQARDDNAVVGLYYEARHIPLDLGNEHVDATLDEIAAQQDAGIDPTTLEHTKKRYSAVERAAGATARVGQLAKDLLEHFTTRQQALNGKAMLVCMTRANCVRLYDALTALPGCPEVKIVMTGNLAEDPPAWSAAGHITTKAKREAIKERFVAADDPLKMVIVCDMWLTGFDAPCANTLYVDKPMKGHTLMQAIARVNRIFQDKPGGLIVDYIGISEQLKAAARKYTSGGGHGELTEELRERAVELFMIHLGAVRAHLPAGQPYASWRELDLINLDDLMSLCYGTLAANEALRTAFLDDEYKLSKAFALVSHLPTCRQHLDEVALYQLIRKQVKKLDAQTKQRLESLDRAVQDLVDESIVAREVIDIFAVAGLEKPDLSILDDAFLAGFSERLQSDLQLRLLARLLEDDITRRRRQNVAQARSFKEMLDAALTRYNNGAIQAADVIRVMIEIRKQQEANEHRKAALEFSDDELAFYDVIVQGAPQGLPTDDAWLAELVRDVVKALRNNLKVDWTRSHRSDVYASVQSAVSRVLRRRRISGEQFEFLLRRLMNQAEERYSDWPMAA